MTKKLSLESVDIVKGIAIILVMIGHSTMFTSIKELALLNVFIYSFHMPLFFIVGGFFLKDKINLKKTVKRLLTPFLIASIFWVFIASILVQLPTYFRSAELYPVKYSFIEQSVKFLKAVFFATRIDILGTGLWFLVALFIGRVFWYVLHTILKLKITVKYIALVFVINFLLYNYLNLPESRFYWMWPQSILAYLFLLFGYYFYKSNSINKLSYLDAFILMIVTVLIIKWNGRIDMSSFKFNNYFAFMFISLVAFIIIYKFSFFIEKYSRTIKLFLIWCGKHSLNIFLVHPFLLAIVPYILIANFNIKEVYSRIEYLLLIYLVVFLIVYLYEKIKRVNYNKKGISISNN